jgi:hypothetical protein
VQLLKRARTARPLSRPGVRQRQKAEIVVSWWKRKQDHGLALTAWNPATDEASLDRCVRRLHEILEELGPIGAFFEKTGDVTPGSSLAERTAAEMNRLRVPGYCAYKLTLEAWTLMELIAVRVVGLRQLYAQTTQSTKLAKLAEIQAITERVEPMLRTSLSEMEMYSSLDGHVQLEMMLKRGPRR